MESDIEEKGRRKKEGRIGIEKEGRLINRGDEIEEIKR